MEVDDSLSGQLEGKDTVTWSLLADRALTKSTQDWALLDRSTDGDIVVTGNKRHVINEELADILAVEEVGEGGVADLESEDGGVGDGGEADEVVAVGVGLEVDGGIGDLETLKGVETWGFVSITDLVRKLGENAPLSTTIFLKVTLSARRPLTRTLVRPSTTIFTDSEPRRALL